MGFFEIIGQVAISTVAAFGYFGVFILMAMESMVFPVPSELVMPLAGFLAGRGIFDFWLVVLVSALGSIAGSLSSYWIGRKFGHRVVLRYGKLLLLDETHLREAEERFRREGEKTIFVSRFIPVVRHLISIPAGIGKMDLKKFCAYTFAGSAIWNAILAFAGFELGENWPAVRNYLEPISIVVAFCLAIAVVFFLAKRGKSIKAKNKTKV